MKLAKKAAIVTGAGGGIGRSIARVFAEEGADVVIAEIDLPSAERVAGELRPFGVRALPIEVDVSVRTQVEAMVSRSIDELGKVDVLVNNAAWADRSFQLFHESDEAAWERTIGVTYRGVLNCCKAAIPHMVERKWGRIVNITSDAGIAGIAARRQAVYASCKGAVAAFSRALAYELAPYGILVNCDSPGVVDTGRNDELPSGTVERWLKGIPLRRLGRPEEIAATVLFLASDDSSYVTGEQLRVNGGGGS